MSVKQAQREVSSREFIEWIGFYTLEPFGDARGDLQAARICETVEANLNKKPRSFEKFVLDFDQRPQTVEEMKSKIAAAANTRKHKG